MASTLSKIALATWATLSPALCVFGDDVAENADSRNLLESARAAYDAVTNMSCYVKRDMPIPEKDTVVKRISMVWFSRGGRMAVENIYPMRRTIICDGTNLVSKFEGEAATGDPVTNLADSVLANLRSVPGSFQEVMAPFDASTEKLLGPSKDFPRRASYTASADGQAALAATLCLDAQDRVARIEIRDAASSNMVSSIDYSRWEKVAPGVWFAKRQKATFHFDGGRKLSALTNLEKLKVNYDMSDKTFDTSVLR